MNYLLTNDDGIDAPGLWTAARTLAEHGTVLVVAPAQNYSGYGAALPPNSHLSYQAVTDHNLGLLRNVTAFAVSGTPATCVQVGLSGALTRRPVDLVVSGINDAANVGRDIFFSGTFGAALTAHLLGAPSLAISLDGSPGGILHWDSAAWALAELARTWQTHRPSPILFNVNVPNLPPSEICGLQQTALSKRVCLERYRVSARTERLLQVVPRPEPMPSDNEAGTDARALLRGHVSVTPLRPFPESTYPVPTETAELPLAVDWPRKPQLVKTP